MPRRKRTALERARDDLKQGRPDLARDRLTGYLYTQHQAGHYDPEAYTLLGQCYFVMRDLPRAGAAWLLTEHVSPDVAPALEAFHKRFGQDPVNVLRAVKPRAPTELYPLRVQERLAAWNYRYVPFRSRAHPRANQDTPDAPREGLRPIEIGCLVACVVVGMLMAYFFVARFFPRRW